MVTIPRHIKYKKKDDNTIVLAFEWQDCFDFLLCSDNPFGDLFPLMFVPLDKRPKKKPELRELPFFRYSEMKIQRASLKIGKASLETMGDRKDVELHDWVVKDSEGKYNAYKPEEFKEMFEKVIKREEEEDAAKTR